MSGAATANGSFSQLAAGKTDATDITVGIDTATVGTKSGAVTLLLSSDGTGIDSNGVTALPAQALQVSGTVYREAAASITAPGNLIVHVGDAGNETFTVKNSAANDGYSENLVASVAGTSGNITASGTTGDIAAQASSSTITAHFSTAAAGVVSGAVTVALASDGSGIDGLGTTSLGQQTVSVNPTVNNYAKAAIREISGGGTLVQNGNHSTLTLDLGPASVQAPDTARFNLGVLNDVAGPSDFLSGSFSAPAASGFTLTGLSAFSGLAAGQSDTAPTVSFKATAAGTYTETMTLHSTGSNASGYSSALADQTITIVVNVGQTYSPTNKADTVHGGAGNNVIVATNGTLNAGDKIDGGPDGHNTLALQGGGTFDLHAPATLTDIQTMTAQEGAGSAWQTLYLRDGLSATVNVASAAAGAKNPGITIHGANDSDTINLGSGNDDVFLGSTAETVNGGNGNDTFHVTAATIGATLHGSTGSNLLDVTGGGTMAMGSNITGIKTVSLESSPTSYTFTTNATAGLTINDGGRNDTIIVAGSGDTINASHATIYLNAGVTSATIVGNDDIVHIQSGDTYKLVGSHDTVITDTVVTAQNGSTIAHYNGLSTEVDLPGLSFDPSIQAGYALNWWHGSGDLIVRDHGATVDTIHLASVQNVGSPLVAPDGNGGTLLLDTVAGHGNSDAFNFRDFGPPGFQDAAHEFSNANTLAGVTTIGDQFVFHADQLTSPAAGMPDLALLTGFDHPENLGHTSPGASHSTEFVDPSQLGHVPQVPQWEHLLAGDGFHLI